MRGDRLLVILAAALALTLSLAGAAEAATYTITGRVYLPDGSPAAGANLILCPHTGKGMDLTNSVLRIPGYDYHRVTASADGSFTMTNVQDYPENPTHRYIIFYDGPSPFYHATVHVLLDAETTKTFRVHLKPVTALRLRLTDAAGNPYTGTKAVYMQSGTLGYGPMRGISYIRTVNFVNGVGEMPNVVIKDKSFFYGKIGILQQTTSEQVESTGVEVCDNDAALRLYVMKDSLGRP